MVLVEVNLKGSVLVTVFVSWYSCLGNHHLIQVDNPIPVAAHLGKFPFHLGQQGCCLLDVLVLLLLEPFVLLFLNAPPPIDFTKQSRIHVGRRELSQEVFTPVLQRKCRVFLECPAARQPLYFVGL